MNKKQIPLIALLLLTLLLSACGRSHERIPNTGGESFVLGDYLLETEGLSTLVKELRLYADLPEALRVAYFSADLDKKGYMKEFSLTLYGYDSELAYVGSYGFGYSETSVTGDSPSQTEDGQAEYLRVSEDFSRSFVPEYNENSDLDYLDAQLKKLQLAQQIKLLNFRRYVLSYNGNTKLVTGWPIVDGTDGNPLPLLTLKEYGNGEGGVSNGSTGVYFSLSDGIGVSSENQLYFRFPAANPETIKGDRDFTMQFDYQIIRGVFCLTRDYGETWIEARLPEGALEETLEFYQSNFYIPEDSFSITEKPGVLALIYGENPFLLISRDDGESWRSVDLSALLGIQEYPHPVTRRIVHFFDERSGYIGLGTDWSMGAGEYKAMLVTNDGGESWEVYGLPLEGTSQVLSGLAFADMQRGVVSMKHIFNYEDSIILYYTEDGGRNWFEMELPLSELPLGYNYIEKVDSLSYENGRFVLILGQKEKKASFSALALDGQWQFENYW